MSEGTKLPARFGQDEQRIPGRFGTAMLIKGLTPYIGENGNWWIGDEDTGVAAEGKTPVKGEDYFTETDKAELVAAVLSNFTDVSKEGQ